jgi:hypothetical protein
VQWFVYTSPQRKQGAAAVSTLRRECLAVENPSRCDPSLARRAGVRAGVRRRSAGVQWFVYTMILNTIHC